MFNLEATLFSGQTFAWQKDGSTYRGVIGRHLVSLDASDPFSTIGSDPFLRRYFDLEYPYEEAEAHLEILDPMLGELLLAHRSIHILNQDPWETTLSFITSQNNTIKRIRTLLNTLRQTYGKEVAPNHHALPTPDELLRGSSEEKRSCGLSASDIGLNTSLMQLERATFWQRFRIWQMKKPCRHCVKSMESDRKSLHAFFFSPMDGRMSFPSTRGPEEFLRTIIPERIPHSFRRTEELPSSIFFMRSEERLARIGRWLYLLFVLIWYTACR